MPYSSSNIQTYTFGPGVDVSTPTRLSNFLGTNARLLGVLFSMNAATDASQIILYINVNGSNIPIWTVGMDYTTTVTAGTVMFWLGAGRGQAGLPAAGPTIANSIENFVAVVSSPAQNDHEGGWFPWSPIEFTNLYNLTSNPANATTQSAYLTFSMTQANFAVTTLVYSSGASSATPDFSLT